MKHPAARACQEECRKKPEYIVLELAHDKSIFLEFWPATCANIVLSLAKNFALPLVAATPLCQTTRTKHPMPRSKTVASSRPRGEGSAPSVSLKFLAEHLGLSPATVSLVINRSPAAKSIPHRTQERVRQAARELNYRPNFMARSLRAQRSFTIGVVVPEISDGYAALVMSGIEDHLLEEGYFYFVVSHRHRADLIEEYPRLLQQRAVEGLIAVDTVCQKGVQIPVVAISGHRELEGVTNIALDHACAAKLALEHLVNLGHRKIAFIKGQEFSSDTEVRWQSVQGAAKNLALEINERLVVQLEGESPSPILGYQVTSKLLATGEPFTALFAFNDISAIGAIRALREAGRSVPEDVSVVGFDDIQSAAFQNPALTTVRQPLRQMGILAAETVLGRINAPVKSSTYPKNILVEPELIVRETTARPRA
jgi:DNA-binding LacI/PurR family transcriptional regulator